MRKIIVITGASSGIGALTARALAQAGHVVYAGLRDTAGRNAPQVTEVDRYADEHGVHLQAIELDVSSQESADVAIQTIVADHGRLDVVIHNAGHMVLGPTEAFTPEQCAAVYDTNVIGTQRVNRAALPQLRRQGEGLLVWVGSSSTRGGCPPFLGPYFAAKAAMDALAVSYAGELIRFGIETAIIVPGAYPTGTNHFAHASKPDDADRAAAYDDRYAALMTDVNARLAALLPPDADVTAVAEAIVRVVGLPAGARPLRTHIDPSRDGSEVVSAVADRIRVEFFRRVGLDDLLTAGSSL